VGSLTARTRIELSYRVGSSENNGKKGMRLCKEDFMCVCSETVMNPLPGNELVENAID
jgi:hypothetical protein